jgi:hypothetical protein
MFAVRDTPASSPLDRTAVDKARLIWQGGWIMIVRFPWGKLLLAALCLVPIGCEPHQSWLRPKQDEDAMPDPSSKKGGLSSKNVIGSSPDDQDASTFFESNRRPGGMSSEARAIESHLGADY